MKEQLQLGDAGNIAATEELKVYKMRHDDILDAKIFDGVMEISSFVDMDIRLGIGHTKSEVQSLIRQKINEIISQNR